MARFLKEEVDINSVGILSVALLTYLKSIGSHSIVTVCMALRFYISQGNCYVKVKQ